jgi:hypothetical protein
MNVGDDVHLTDLADAFGLHDLAPAEPARYLCAATGSAHVLGTTTPGRGRDWLAPPGLSP